MPKHSLWKGESTLGLQESFQGGQAGCLLRGAPLAGEHRVHGQKNITQKAHGLSELFPILPPAKELQFYSFTRLHFCGFNWTGSVVVD